MKLYNKSTIALLAALLCGGAFVGCSEDATLEGADKVYITMNPADITLRMGDTVRISAMVENLSGEQINTPIQWSVQDDDVAKVLGDTAVVSQPGAQGRSTKLKALLKNGQYGLANISVVAHLPDGVCAVDTAGNSITSYRSYFMDIDSVTFAVTPKELLQDYVPTYAAEGVALLDNALAVDKERGRFTIFFSSPRKSGTGKITVSIGEDGTAKKASCDIIMMPEVFATFYGEKYDGMPYIDGGHPDKSTLPMYFAYLNETNMDVNSEATVRVAINVQTGAKEDIEAAYGSYRWELESGNSVIVSEMSTEYFPENGFDAILSVRSGIEEGLTTFRCITPDTVLVATFMVQDYKNRYPVESITVDKSPLEMVAGEEYRLQTGVVPMSSYAYHKPVVSVLDPSIATVGEYDGNLIPIKAIGIGCTELLLTSNGKELRVPLTVREDIVNVTWPEGNVMALFEGQSTEWNLNVMTYTGAPNPYAVEWKSSDESIVKAVAGAEGKGVITAVAEGNANITATVDDISTSPAMVKVVKATDMALSAASIVPDGSGIYFNGDDLELYITMANGSVLQLKALGVGAKTNYNGAYNSNLTVTVDEATAMAQGSIIVASGSDGYSDIDIDLAVNLGTKNFTVKATKLQITNW